ncbi:MAG: AraC family transcriptional regulator [Devosia sp.]
MQSIERAVWFIETHFSDEISLDDIAEFGGVSRFHMSRSFGSITGSPVMTYVRGRRLTTAAEKLLNGAPDILAIALDAGYNSHEAFTRAFRDQFGQTPEQTRATSSLDTSRLVPPLRIDQTLVADLEPPRLETGPVLLVAGLSERFTFNASEGIPALWQRFAPYIDNVPGQIGHVTYGVCANTDDTCAFDYIAVVEVKDFSDLAPELVHLRIPQQRYAVFSHRGHISAMRRTAYTIWAHYLPQSTLEPIDAPNFERYGDQYDPQTGNGTVEVWVPIRS